MRRITPVLVVLVFVLGCNKENSPTAPSTVTPPVAIPVPTPTPPAAPRIVILGIVSNQDTNHPVGGVNVSITGSNNVAGRTTTDGNGFYQINDIAGGLLTFVFDAANYNGQTLRETHTTDGRRDVRLAPFFRRAGTGANVFDLPSYVTRLRVTGSYSGFCENFVVWVSRRLIVNEILGSCSVASGRTYDGTHAVTPGLVEVQQSTGLNWELQQVR